MIREQHTGASADTSWLQEAVAVANVPTLACVLVQLTGDTRWISPPFTPNRMRGMDDSDSGGLSEQLQAEIRAAAVAAFSSWFRGDAPALPNPDDDLLLQMMSVMLGEPIPASFKPVLREDLGLATPPASAAEATIASVPSGFRAVIVGAGISGIATAVAFEKAGIPYVILERRPSPGGVWLENRYPGAACDVPSHLYSFSFAPFPWSRFFADSREIHRYLEQVAADYNIVRHIRFGISVGSAEYDAATQRWTAHATNAAGERETFTGNLLLSCVGAFNKPSLPNLPGMDQFRGVSVHTARYPDSGIELHGKRVVLVGNGASAMQVAPAIAPQVASLTMVQRTPQWAAPFPKFGEAIPAPLQRLLAEMPLYRRWYRVRLSWAFNDKLYDALTIDPTWDGGGRSINAINEAQRRGLISYMKAELGEAQHLLPALTPDYPPFGKRMLLDNGWYRTLARQNVSLAVGGVTALTEDGIVLSDGTTRPADVIIWATGFDVVNFLAPMTLRGLPGHEVPRDWAGGDASAYLGSVVPGYPNLFCLYGPNSQFGHGGSLITVLERQVHYLMSLLEQLFAQGLHTFEVKRDVNEEYNRKVQATHQKLVWAFPGVSTYYKNAAGKNVVNNPFRIQDVWQMTQTANLDEYHCQ